MEEGERVDDFKDSDDESSDNEDSDDEYTKKDTQIADFDIPVVRHLRVNFSILFHRKSKTMIMKRKKKRKLIGRLKSIEY